LKLTEGAIVGKEKKKYGTRFKRRPVKTEGERRSRMKVHRKRLILAGFEEAVVTKMDAKALRLAIKTI
jgi:hypothetical protein